MKHENTENNRSEEAQSAHAADAHVGNDSHAADEESSVFSQILDSNMGEHHSIHFGPWAHFDLPYIIYEDGLHVYPNAKAVEESGVFSINHDTHAAVVAKTGEAPTLDMSITSAVFFEWIAMALLILLFGIVSGRYRKRKSDAPSGWQNLVESFYLYVQNEIVRPNVNGDHIARRLMPYFVVLFFFILTMNLMGLIPGGHSPTGSVNVTAGLAIIAFIVINATAIKENGIGAYFKHLLGGAPWWLAFIMVPIEIISLFVKPFALTIRLFANMTAGHVILLSLIGLIIFFQSLAIAPISIGFSLFIYFLEMLVAFIQAYIFTILTAVFVGLAVGDHGHGDEAAEGSH